MVFCQNDEDRNKMQKDIDKLLQWAETWQMEFNAKKCKMMHLGRNNVRYTYCMGGYRVFHKKRANFDKLWFL